MNKQKMKSMDGNTAAAQIAFAFSEASAIYPITPSTGMSELMDVWASQGKKNLFGNTVQVIEMQSEAGAAGAVHGLLSGGVLATTFTASQGLLLMIPNMYKIAGELLPTVFHVSARALATQALSIFGDHQDVMAARATGFCMLCSGSVQEAHDLALVAHLATLRASLPFLHFFDGFRTSHEIQKIYEIPNEDILPLIDQEAILRHRQRALNPEHPYLKGSAQNPDIYFQTCESSNKFYLAAPKIVQEEMDKVGNITGRNYHLFDYVGDKNAENVIVMMGSGAEAVEEAIDFQSKKGDKLGLLKVRLYRPFDKESFLATLPKSVKRIAVLDRTKESGAFAEPLYVDVASVLQNSKRDVQVVGGRYGLGSKEFTPNMAIVVFENLKLPVPKNHFTVGIVDDVTFTSLPITSCVDTEKEGIVRCKFWGIGGDGTVGANKDAIKIIGDNTNKYVQGYFSYDSKKSFGVTISHLRFGDYPIKATYLIEKPDYVACHTTSYVKKFDVLQGIRKGGTFVLNSPWSLDELEKELPNEIKREIAEKELHFYNIDAVAVAKEAGFEGSVNMVMQTVFFKLANILPIEKAIALLKEAITKTYGKKGEEIVALNKKAVDLALAHLKEIKYPKSWATLPIQVVEKDVNRPPFVRDVADMMNAQEGDDLPVSAFAPGGVFPLGTTRYEKRDIAIYLPRWIPERCIQCNICSFVCPHATIRPFLLTEEEAKKAPDGYVGIKATGKGMENKRFSIEVSALDCTGCGNCVEACPAPGKALERLPAKENREREAKNWEYVTSCAHKDVDFNKFTIKGSQFKEPLFEFSGACSGCGETPYLKLLTQLFGERIIIANATGCTSIWGGSAPSIPWTLSSKGCGPAWANSLFEDNAEYGLGIGIAQQNRRSALVEKIMRALKEGVGGELKPLFEEWLKNIDDGEKSQEIAKKMKTALSQMERNELLEAIFKDSDIFTKPSVWMVGGDGWAYDIGYGGLDHVLALDKDVNVLVLDTEVYSNTGGQSSKATPLGATAKFASHGKKTMKKDLGLIAMTYGHIYVASVSLGYDRQQVVKAMKEAESFDGPSLIIAYASCISHGIKGGMIKSDNEEKRAVECGYWINYRYDPRLKKEGKNPLQIDSKEPTFNVREFLLGQRRYSALEKSDPEEAKRLFAELEERLKERYNLYKKLSQLL